MTILIGVLCSDGAVIGTDSSATFSVANKLNTVEQPCKKLFVINNFAIVATTGSVGLGQRICYTIDKLVADNHFQDKDHQQCALMISQAVIQNLGQTSAPQGQVGALVAFPNNKRPALVEFDLQSFQPEFKDENIWYVSMGSGQLIADPFLALMRRCFCENGLPKLSEGIFMTAWALDHTIEVNPGGIKDPLRIAVLKHQKKGQYKAYELTEDELAEHRNHVEEVYGYLAEYPSKLANQNAPSLPDPPKK